MNEDEFKISPPAALKLKLYDATDEFPTTLK